VPRWYGETSSMSRLDQRHLVSFQGAPAVLSPHLSLPFGCFQTWISSSFSSLPSSSSSSSPVSFWWVGFVSWLLCRFDHPWPFVLIVRLLTGPFSLERPPHLDHLLGRFWKRPSQVWPRAHYLGVLFPWLLCHHMPY
jgi:hypothetical protein